METIKRMLLSGSIYGKLMVLAGGIMLVPLFLLPFYPEEKGFWVYYAAPAVLSLVSGIVLCFGTMRTPDTLSGRRILALHGSTPVLFAWIYLSLLGAVPFWASGELTFTRALFESVSGWTTTGLTVMIPSRLPHILLFQRSMMQYFGGLGFIILVTTIVRRKTAMSFYSAEGHVDRLMPNLMDSARLIIRIYLGLLGAGTLCYILAGIPAFDALCHSMSALSTAGFSTQDGSIGAFRNRPAEIITIVQMLLGATNFYVILLILRRQFRKIWQESEIRLMAGLLLVFTLPISVILWQRGPMSLPESFHQALFGVVTTFSTTGYSLMDYSRWPGPALALLPVLMIVGGCAGSTAGGIKLMRGVILLKVTATGLHDRVDSPRNVTDNTFRRNQEDHPIDRQTLSDTFSFLMVYLLILAGGIFLVSWTADCSVSRAAFEFTSALGTVGLSNGLTASAPAPTLWVIMAGMLIGRLEWAAVFVSLYSIFRSLCRIPASGLSGSR